MLGSSPSNPMTITFLRNKRPELGSSLGTAVWGFGTDACAGTAERPYYSEENPYYFVPKDKQQAKHAGQPGGYSHYLVRSEERRVGKSVDLGGGSNIEKKEDRRDLI